jgi:hypothetical protein
LGNDVDHGTRDPLGITTATDCKRNKADDDSRLVDRIRGVINLATPPIRYIRFILFSNAYVPAAPLSEPH